LIKLQHGGLGENLGEQQTLCRAIFKHAGSLSCCFKRSLDNLFVAQQASRAFNLYEFSGLSARVQPVDGRTVCNDSGAWHWCKLNLRR
jgi:hypothetical protein